MNRIAILLSKGSFSPLLPSPPDRILRSPSFSPIIARKFFSSKGDSSSPNSIQGETNPATNRSPEDDASSDSDDVSTEELKRRIDKYWAGDKEALPSIARAIMLRRLSGKHDDSDDELLEELRSMNGPHSSRGKGNYDLTTSDDEDESSTSDDDSGSSS